METLGLEITKPYKDLYSFDLSRVKCLGLIKDLCVNLSQIPAKSLVMDIVVADIPPKYGMLLSRSWGAKLQGSLQMDMSYATIPVFNQNKRLYRESHMKYMVSNIDKPKKSPIYSIQLSLDSFILCNEDEITQQDKENTDPISSPEQSNLPSNQIQNIDNRHQQENENEANILWKINFDGSCNKTSAGVGVWIKNMNQSFSYKLDFPCTKNIAEYEALLLGLQLLKQLEAQRISILGDSELIIKQIRGEYSTRNPRLREYQNVALDLLKTFEK